MFSMQDMERIIKQQFQQHLSVSAATSTSGPKPNTGGKGSGGKNKNTAPADAWCYYCLQKGHYSRDEECTKRREDRAKGIYRPTYKDPPMSLEEFKALPTEIKTKGKWQIPGAGPPPPGLTVSTTGRVHQQHASPPHPFQQQDYPAIRQEEAFTSYFARGQSGNY